MSLLDVQNRFVYLIQRQVGCFQDYTTFAFARTNYCRYDYCVKVLSCFVCFVYNPIIIYVLFIYLDGSDHKDVIYQRTLMIRILTLLTVPLTLGVACRHGSPLHDRDHRSPSQAEIAPDARRRAGGLRAGTCPTDGHKKRGNTCCCRFICIKHLQIMMRQSKEVHFLILWILINICFSFLCCEY